MKPHKYRPSAFRWEDDNDSERNERVRREVDTTMKPIVDINQEIKNKFTNLQGFISDMIEQNIGLMKNTCERQLHGYKSQKRRLKGFINKNSSLFENQPDVISLQTELEDLRVKVTKLEERANIMHDSYETAQKIAYEKNEIVKKLRKEVRLSQKSTLDTRYKVYSYSSRLSNSPPPLSISDLHKRSSSSQYSPRKLQNLPYLVPKHLDFNQRTEYQSYRETVNLLKNQIESKRREQQSVSLSNGVSPYLSYKAQDFLIDCIASISKSYGMYQNINKARYNEKMNLVDAAFNLIPSYKKPGYMTWPEFISKTPRDIVKLIEKYPVILKVLKLSVSNLELFRRNDVPYNTSVSPEGTTKPIDCLKLDKNDISMDE